MSAEKIEHKHTYSVKSQIEAKKLMEIKNLINEGQKKIGFDQKLSEMLNYQTELWSVTQAAKELGVTRPTIYKMYERGDIQGVTLDGLKIVPSSVVEYIKRQEGVRAKALAELHKIDQQLKPETRGLVSGKETSEFFEDIDLE